MLVAFGRAKKFVSRSLGGAALHSNRVEFVAVRRFTLACTAACLFYTYRMRLQPLLAGCSAARAVNLSAAGPIHHNAAVRRRRTARPTPTDRPMLMDFNRDDLV